MVLEDGVVNLEVVIPTITRMGDVVKDGMVTSFVVVRKEVVVEEVPIAIPQDVSLIHLCLQWSREGQHDIASISHHVEPHNTPTKVW